MGLFRQKLAAGLKHIFWMMLDNVPQIVWTTPTIKSELIFAYTFLSN